MPSVEARWEQVDQTARALYPEDTYLSHEDIKAAVLAFALEAFDLAQQARDDCSPGWSRFGPARKLRCVHYAGGKRVCAVAQERARLAALADPIVEDPLDGSPVRQSILDGAGKEQGDG